MAVGREIKEKPSSDEMIDIVLDIDMTLAIPFENVQLSASLNARLIEWFQSKNLCICTTKPNDITHLLYPGTLEFIQYLYSLPNVVVHFYSAGLPERNQEFVQVLLTRALGSVPENVTVLSTRDDNNDQYIKRSKEIRDGLRTYLGIDIKETQNDAMHMKDLCRIKCVSSEESKVFSNTVLIDDNHQYIATLLQAKNFMFVPRLKNNFDGNVDDDTMNGLDQIYYITGLLMHLFSMNGDSLSQKLFSMQFRAEMAGKYQLKVHELYADKKYYYAGLVKLRKFNVFLNFYQEISRQITFSAMLDKLTSKQPEKIELSLSR